MFCLFRTADTRLCPPARQAKADGRTIRTLKDGDFVGEMAFLAGDYDRGKVVHVFGGDAETIYLAWDFDQLREFLSKNPQIEAAMMVGGHLLPPIATYHHLLPPTTPYYHLLPLATIYCPRTRRSRPP